MRFFAIALILLFAADADAQIGGTNLWGGTPRNLVFTPIDTSKAIGMNDLSRAFRTPSAPGSSLNLSNLFRSVSLPTFPPTAPQTSVLPQSQNIFQPNPIKGGVNLFAPKQK